jgi:hypothetical protein
MLDKFRAPLLNEIAHRAGWRRLLFFEVCDFPKGLVKVQTGSIPIATVGPRAVSVALGRPAPTPVGGDLRR